MQRLRGLDAAFLYGETPSWHMHVAALLVADPSDIPGGWDFQRLKRVTAERLPLLPQFRWKLVEVPFGLDRPGWVEEPDFDIDYHIRRIGVPAPGGPKELGDLVGDLIGYKLDRRKPLWEMWVIEGLEGGNVAVLTKIHHAIIDGVSGAGLAQIILDTQPEPAPAPTADQVVGSLDGQRVPGSLELIAKGLVRSAMTPIRTTRYVMRQLIPQGVAMVPFLRREQSPAMPFQAPRTRWNDELSPHRSIALTSVPLSRVKAIKDAFGVKVNDVVLALCAGALRNYLEHHDELPDAPLIAQVPVSMRAEGEENVVGTKVASMFASLATHVDDPGERLRAIHDSTCSAKEMQHAMEARKIMGLTDTSPPGLIALAARTYSAAGLDGRMPPIFNVIVSNVPGPPMPLFVNGARLLTMAPMGPLLYGGGLNITVISYVDSLDFGFQACRELIDDPSMIADFVPVALEELEKAAAKLP